METKSFHYYLMFNLKPNNDHQSGNRLMKAEFRGIIKRVKKYLTAVRCFFILLIIVNIKQLPCLHKKKVQENQVFNED